MLPWVRYPDLEPQWQFGRDVLSSNRHYEGRIFRGPKDGQMPHFALIPFREPSVESYQYCGDVLYDKDATVYPSHRISTRLEVVTKPAQLVGTGPSSHCRCILGSIQCQQLGPAQIAATVQDEKVNDSNQGLPWNSTLLPFSQLGRGLTSWKTWFPTPQSPFSAFSTLLMHVLVLFQLLFPNSLWGKSKAWLLLALVPQALPVAASRGECILRISLLACTQHFTSHTWQLNGRFGRTLHQHLRHLRHLWDPGILPTRTPHLTLVFIALLGTLRIGEAKNPGPEIQVSTQNVMSMARHLDLLDEIPPNCITAFTETCTTKTIFPLFKSKANKNKLYTSVSALSNPRPNAIRGDSEYRGQAGGVALVSTFPARPSCIPIPTFTWLSTRVAEFLVAVSPTMVIRVIGIYGHPNKLPTAPGLTNQLLEDLDKHIYQSSIPCIIMGDFNVSLDQLPAICRLTRRGWWDAAELYCSQTGIEPEPTWNHQSRIDFIVISPALVPLFRSLLTKQDAVSDHANVTCVLSIPDGIRYNVIWKRCKDSGQLNLHSQDEELQHIDWGQFTNWINTKNVEQAYKAFCINFDTAIEIASTTLGINPGPFRGRKKAKKIQEIPSLPVIRRSRVGEPQPCQDDSPLWYRQHIRQIRRLHAVLGQIRAAVRQQSESAMYAANSTWTSVLRANSFYPDFKTWIDNNMHVILPDYLIPSHLGLVQWVYDFLRAQESSWVYSLVKAKDKALSEIMDADWNKGASRHFHSIKPPPRDSPSLFDVPSPTTITRHRHDKNGPYWITSHNDIPKEASFIQFQDQRVPILRTQGTNVQIGKPLIGPAQMSVDFITVTADRDKVFHMIHRYWRRFWEAQPQIDEALLEQVLLSGPSVPAFSATIGLDELRKALQKLNINKARGPDSWSNADLKQMPESFLPHLQTLLQAFTDTASWPQALLHATVTMLSKVDSTFDIGQTRPITILSCLYRLWSKIMAKKFIDNVVGYLPEGIQGNRPGASSKWIATYTQILSEYSMEEAENLSIISLDLTKAYNVLARELLKRTNKTFGTPLAVVDSYFAFLDAVQRSFLVYGALSNQQSSNTGVPEGCAFAVYNMLQLNWVVSTYIDIRREEQLSVTFISYVDNWLMHSYHLSALREAYEAVHLASEAFGFIISPTKTWASSTSSDLRKALRTWFPPNSGQVVQHKQELGCLLRFSKQPSIQDAFPRWEDGLYRIDRLIHQKWSIARKIRVIRQGVFPQLFSGCETFHISLSTFKKFRAKLNVAVHGKATRGSHYLSPIFTHLMDYEPFLYVFTTRLSSLKSTIMSFRTPAREAWNYACNLDLNAQYQKVLGPISAFIWGCQVLSWQCKNDFTVVTEEGETLHLLQSPLVKWEQSCRHSWMKFIISRCHFAQNWPEIWIPFRTWDSLWTPRESPPPLATKFRTLGLLTASAVASVQQRDDPTCEFCNELNGGQLHLATECSAFRDIRDSLDNSPLSFHSMHGDPVQG